MLVLLFCNAKCVRAAGTCTEECVPTSPRSVEACLRLGIDPFNLVHRPLDAFKSREEDEDIAKYRWQQYENARQVTAMCVRDPSPLVRRPLRTL